MRNFSLAALFLVISPTLFAQVADVPTSEPNCSLISPPSGTKSKGSHLGFLLGYPEQIHSEYTGCLHLWVADDKQGQDWGLKMSTYFINGKPRLYVERLQEVGRGEGKIQLVCHYDGGNPVTQQRFQVGKAGNISQCPPASTLEEYIRH
jgi:hypothetical protein